MKLVFGLIAASLLMANARADVPITLTVSQKTSGPMVPTNFVGLSFGMRALLPNAQGKHFFDATNTGLVTLIKNIGVTHLRLGGTTVESPPSTAIPNEADIDSLFGFVRAAGIGKIIYSFRLLETNVSLHYEQTNAALAKYIWNYYRTNVDCFALGNEPDLRRVYNQDATITNFATYLSQWRKFAAAITNAVPDAKFAGPDGGSGNVNWTTRFATAEKDSGLISVITEHFYVGGAGRGVSPQTGIDTMLSPDWVAADQMLYNKVTVPVRAEGLGFRFTEANDHYSGGVANGSDTFAGALWALDFLHWWAAHEAMGVDFHNTQWVVNDVITPGENGDLTINPKGYGLRAFELGGHGRVEAVTISRTNEINLTAYAVRGSENLLVTIINKEHGPTASAAQVTIAAEGTKKIAEVIYLTSPNNDVSSKTGVTLGGAVIGNDRPWVGTWTSLPTTKSGECSVKVAPGSAAIVKISNQ